MEKIIQKIRKYVMRCTIWYHLYNLKNVKNNLGGVLILVINCTNDTKSLNVHIFPKEVNFRVNFNKNTRLEATTLLKVNFVMSIS